MSSFAGRDSYKVRTKKTREKKKRETAIRFKPPFSNPDGRTRGFANKFVWKLKVRAKAAVQKNKIKPDEKKDCVGEQSGRETKSKLLI